MPEPTLAGQGAQTEQIASTPQETADQQPTTVTQNEGEQLQGLMDHLDIPQELHERIAATVTNEPLPGTTPPPSEPQQEEQEKAGEKEDEDEDEGEEEQPAAADQQGQQAPDKRQKRINRLTRQKRELETRLDSAVSELEQVRQAIAQQQPGQQPQPVPSATARLAHISDEHALAQEESKARAIMDWCDANAEGLTTEGADGQEQYHAPDQIAKWRREAEKVVLDAPRRRDEIRVFSAARQEYDQIAQNVWPELFDKSTPEHQAAAQLLQQYPNIRATPQANYAAGLVIEGVRSLMARLNQANGQQPTKATRDIDPRVFTTPRVPLAPHSPEPPSREAKPSSQRVLNETLSKLQNDPDGSAESLAAAFNALDATKRTRAHARSPVKV